MLNIYYSKDKSGRETAKWPGVSKRIEITHEDGTVTREPRKVGQMHLGFVIDKDLLLFYRQDIGFYRFHPEDLTCEELLPDEIPIFLGKKDGRKRDPPVVIFFGGSFFLGNFIPGIGYNRVIARLKYGNLDRLYTMIHYYLLAPGPAYAVEAWYDCDYAKFLYPGANPTSQRLSEFYAAIGTDNNKQAFLDEHIKYVLKSTGEELCVIVDSAGLPNKCKIPFTRVSNHDGDVNIEFRVILVIQKSTGLPLYYEKIPGNVVDSSTINNVIKKLEGMGYKVTYGLGDAAYSCPANLERLILSGVDFLTRLNPAYETYKSAIEAHARDLENRDNDVLFHGRVVTVVKIPTVIAHDPETEEEKQGFIYLCRDHNAWHSKSTHFMNSKQAKGKTHSEITAICEKFGVFALASTKDLPTEDVLSEYYTRQAVEQFFDFAKNYANLLPVRNHNVATVNGHLLMSFIATFFIVLIKNKLNIMDCDYVAIPDTLQDEMDDTPYVEVDTQQGVELMIRQEKQLEIFKASPRMMFNELQFQTAEVFPNMLVPAYPVANASAFYKAFHIGIPEFVKYNKETRTVTPSFSPGEGNNCTRRIAFTRKSHLTDEQIEERRRKGELKKLEETAEKHGVKIFDENSQMAEATQQPTTSGESDPREKAKRGPGRPKGTKNKKTIEREAKEAADRAAGLLPPKRGRGRPPGSKNKKTIEKEQIQSSQ